MELLSSMCLYKPNNLLCLLQPCAAQGDFTQVFRKNHQTVLPVKTARVGRSGGTVPGGNSDTGWNKRSVILELVHLVIDVIKKRSDGPIFPLNEDLSMPQGRGAGWWKVWLGASS